MLYPVSCRRLSAGANAGFLFFFQVYPGNQGPLCTGNKVVPRKAEVSRLAVRFRPILFKMGKESPGLFVLMQQNS